MEDDTETTELPMEIICSEILPRLPVKSLLRYRCVCKSWSSLIVNPSFATKYRNLCSGERKRRHVLFFTCETKNPKQRRVFSVQLNQGDQTPATHVLTLNQLYRAQSIEGLVCLSPSKTSSSYLEAAMENRVHIFNPSTRQMFSLPQTSRVNITVYVAYHFGFSSITNEYTVLQIQKYKQGLIFNTFILGRSTTWSQIEVDLADLPFDPLEFRFDTTSLSIDGAIHWPHPILNSVVAFDMIEAHHRFRVLPIPDGIYLHDSRVRLDIVDGCLALLDWRKQQNNMKRLWILNKTQVWIKEDKLFPIPYQNDIVQEADIRLRHYNMKTNCYRRIEILLPEWRKDSQMLEILTIYNEGIVPLRWDLAG